MRGAVDQKQDFKLWLTSRGYDNNQIMLALQAIDRADILSPNADFWTMQNISDYQDAITALKKSIKIRLFYRGVLEDLDLYGAIYSEYLGKRKASAPSANTPAAYLQTVSTPVTELTSVEDTTRLETPPPEKEQSSMSVEAIFAPDPTSVDFNEVESETEAAEEARTKLDVLMGKSDVEYKPDAQVESGVEVLTEPVDSSAVPPVLVKTPTRKKNKTYFQDEMEDFYCWLNENGHMSIQEVKSCISALKTCELFAKENIASDLALFTSNTNIAVITVNALSADPVFRNRDSEHHGRYSSALEKYQNHLKKHLNATGLQPFSGMLEKRQNPVSNESISSQSSALCALLESQNIQFQRSDHNYIFVEENVISPELLRKIKRMNEVISVTTIRRFRKNCLRIRLTGDTDSSAARNTSSEESALKASADITSVAPPVEESDADTNPTVRKDALLHLLDERGLRYIDKRAAGGRLWILGDASLRDEMQELFELGLRFFYARGGSKSIQWQSGWYLYEQGSKLPFVSPDGPDVKTMTTTVEPTPAVVAPAPQIERYKLVTSSTIYIGDGPSGAFAAFCDDLALNYQGRFRSLVGRHYYGSGPIVLSDTRQDEYTVSLKQFDAYVSSTLTIHQALNFGQWLCRLCGEQDYPLRVIKCLPDEEIMHLASEEAQLGTQLEITTLAPVAISAKDENSTTQAEAYVAPCEEVTAKNTVEAPQESNEIFTEGSPENHVEEPNEEDAVEPADDYDEDPTAEPDEKSTPVTLPIPETQTGYKLATASAAFYGSDPANSFVAYCAYLAKKDPKRFNALLDKQYFGRGPIVLSGTGNDRYSRKVDGTNAYVLDTLSDTYALLFGRWLGGMFREAELPTEVVSCNVQPKRLTLETSENEDIPIEAVETQIPEAAPVFAEAAPEATVPTVDKSVASQEATPSAVVQTVSIPVHTPVVTAAAEVVELSDELHSLLSDPDLLVLREALIQDKIVALDQFSQLDLLDYMNGHSIYGREHRQEIQQRIQNRLAGSGAKPEEKRFKLVTDKAHYYGDTQEEAFIAFCDHAAFEHPALFRALLNKKYNNQGRVVFSRERKPDMPLKLNQLNAYVRREMGAQHIILYAIWVNKMCNMHENPLRIVDTRSMAATEAPGIEAAKQNTVSSTGTQATVPVKHAVNVEESTETSRELSPELQDVLKDDDMLILRKNLLRDGILTIEQLQNINLWFYMNRKNLYLSVKKRQEISARIKKRLQQREMPEEPCFRLVSGATAFSGNTPALALAAYCEYLSMAFLAKFKNLINKKYYGQGSVVLQSLIPNGKYVKVENVRAYLDGNLNAQAALNYARWLGTECGDPTAAQFTLVTREPEIPQQKPLSPFSKVPAPAVSAAPKPAAPASKSAPAVTPNALPQPAVRSGFADNEKRLMEQINELVLQADLDGIELTALADRLRQNVSYTRQLVERMPQIVQFGDKLIHEDSFVDWEEGAEQLEEILGKLLDRNDGYVSAAQLYEYARVDMQMFLNDNDMDSERPVYDMAQHLFGKVGYHGKRLSFQSRTHISRKDVEVSSALDIIRNYAVAQDGVIDEESLAQYLQSLGMKAGNTRLTMRIYNQPIFFIYGGGMLLYSESMGMNEDWFDTMRKALENLFADLGDHVVLRDIQHWWFMQLPSLPGGKEWTLPLLQNVLYFYSKQLGARTINAMSGQTYETVHAMLVRLDSEIQSFPDAVAAFLVDSGIPERRFEAEQLRQLLVQRGMIAGGELYTNMPKALAKDFRFAWDADGQHVTIKV